MSISKMYHQRVRVVTDSAADIPEETAKSLNITVVPHNIRFGSEQFLDGVDLSRDEFYKRIIAGMLPATTQPSVGAFSEVYQSLSRSTDQIISIHTASKLTGTVNAAKAASNDIPKLNVVIIDSTQLSIGTGLLVTAAARAAIANETLENIKALIEDTVPRVYLYGVADSLEYALRGGRLGDAKALLGRVLAVKPIVQVAQGRLLPVGLARTRRSAIQKLSDILYKLGRTEDCTIIHMHGLNAALDLQTALIKVVSRESIPIVEAGPAIGTHSGPGSFGFACIRSTAQSI